MNTNIFWYFKRNGSVNLNYTQLYRFLDTKGIGQIELVDSRMLVVIIDHIVREIDDTYISQVILNHVRNYLEDIKQRDKVEEAIRLNVGKIISSNQLKLLEIKSVDIKRDTSSISYMYYRNQFLQIEPNSITALDYSELDGHVWETKLLDRSIEVLHNSTHAMLEHCVFAKFLWNISGEKQVRYNGICSMIGYLLHEYKDPKIPKTIVLMDEVMSDNPNGGTGKGIIKTAISKMREVLVQDGKNFKWGQFAFQDVKPSTSILAFDDVPRNFNSEKLFSAMTEELIVERKGKTRIRIPEQDSPKILITTNYVLKGKGESNIRRREEFELSNYYNINHTPFDDFNHTFFSEWDEAQYNLFDNFMIQCVQLYLKQGIISVSSINLNKKKIEAETCPEFVEFISEIRTNKLHYRNELRVKFENIYPEICEDRCYTKRQFFNWIRLYADHQGYHYTTKRASNGETSFEYQEEIELTREERIKRDELRIQLNKGS